MHESLIGLSRLKKLVMSYYQGADRRLITGGSRGVHRSKRKYELGGPFTATSVTEGSGQAKHARMRGGGLKVKAVKVTHVNVSKDDAGVTRVKIQSIERTPANVEYARRGIITRGTIVKTELGLVKITSRPGQSGSVNGVLVKDG